MERQCQIWQAPWKHDRQVVQPEAFTHVCSIEGGMGVQGALWATDAQEPVQKRRAWGRSKETAAVASGASFGGSVPSGDAGQLAASSAASESPAGQTGASFGGSVPSGSAGQLASSSAASAAPAGQTLTQKRGSVCIRSVAKWQRIHNDLLLELGLLPKRLWVDRGKDGRDPEIQEQVLGTQHVRHLIQNAKNVIRRHLSTKGGLVRVVTESHQGRHRSVAVAEELGRQCSEFAHVELKHMCVHRWDPTYAEQPADTAARPHNMLVLKPESRNAL